MNKFSDGVYQLITYPDSFLHEVSEECTEADLPLIKDAIKPMLHIMKAYDGIGLAGVQAGMAKRFCLMLSNRITPDKATTEDLIVIINPIIADPKEFCDSELVSSKEGCLSLPHFSEIIPRPKQVTIAYRDLDWKAVTAVFVDIEARCMLHEMDHMMGQLQIDWLSPMKRDMYFKKLKKLERHGKVK